MNTLSRIFEPNLVWSVAVYIEGPEFSVNERLGSPGFVLDARSLRNGHGHIHTYADPFLFPFGDELYLFYESQAVGENGSIWAYKTTDLENYVPAGEVLREPFHLSYPFVFGHEGSIYMVPESSANDEVALYKFDEFPNTLRKQRTLLSGKYFDSSLIKHDDLWFLFTTSERGLEIFFTNDIEDGTLYPHPSNPVTRSPKFSRCGGGPIVFDGQMYRIAQDGSKGYGENIHILKINDLSKTSYDEDLVIENYFQRDQSWNRLGGHHLSFADFGGKRIIAVDGRQKDLFINKLMALFYK